MTTPVFGLVSEFREEVTELVKNLLLVAGGYLVGYLLGGMIGWALGRWVLRRKTPETLKRFGRPVGGVILALVVALIVFTERGKPPGDGGDGKGTPNTETTPGKNATPRVELNPKVDSRISIPKNDTIPADSTIRITVLAGKAVHTEGKFYLIDDDADSARSLAEIKKAILDRKAATKGKLILAILFPSDPNLAPPRNDQKVTDVTRWATEEAGLDVTFPATR